MQNAFFVFKTNIDILRTHLHGSEQLEDIIQSYYNCPYEMKFHEKMTEYIKYFQTNHTHKKLIDYSSAVISLYGFFEQYISKLIESYINIINALIINYSDHSEVFRNHHAELTYELIKHIKHKHYKGLLNESTVVYDLNSCLNINFGYKLTPEAFSRHTANYRNEVVKQMMERMGISDVIAKIQLDKDFCSYADQISYSVKDLCEMINELAERRNQIAHGLPSNIISTSKLVEMLDGVFYYGSSLLNILTSHCTELLITSYPMKYTLYSKFKNIYPSKKVVCLYVENLTIEIGDTLYFKNTDNYYFEAKIINIHHIVDTISIPKTQLSITTTEEICLELDISIKHLSQLIFINS